MFKDKTFVYWLFCKPIGRQFVVNILVSIGVLITGDFTLSPQNEWRSIDPAEISE